MEEATIQPLKNGPYLVKGVDKLIDYQGNEYKVEERFALCRCGGSSNKPFCDATHRKIGFSAEETAKK